MPLLQIIPVEANKLKLKGIYILNNKIINRFIKNTSICDLEQKKCHGCGLSF